jgi:hypothetical protein
VPPAVPEAWLALPGCGSAHVRWRGCCRRNLGGTPPRPGALLEVYAQVKGSARLRRVAVCKTVGLAYVGSNPTPATCKAARQDRCRRSSEALKVSGLRHGRPGLLRGASEAWQRSGGVLICGVVIRGRSCAVRCLWALRRDWGVFPELARNSIWPWPSLAVLRLTVLPAPAVRSARGRTLQRDCGVRSPRRLTHLREVDVLRSHA